MFHVYKIQLSSPIQITMSDSATRIANMFILMVQVAKNVRENDPKIDGRAFWEPMKNITTKYDKELVPWIAQSSNETRLSFFDKYKELESQERNADGTMNEKNHFLVQIYRIPRDDVANLRKIMQIALNIGQYQGQMSAFSEHSEHEIVASHKLPTLYDFVNKEHCGKLSQKITVDDFSAMISYLEQKLQSPK